MIAFATIMASTQAQPNPRPACCRPHNAVPAAASRTFPPHFGSAGAVLVVLMFIANGLAADLSGLRDSFLLVMLLITARAAAKLLAVLTLAHYSGISLRQAMALGMALIPMSSVALLLTLDTAVDFSPVRFRVGAGTDELYRDT